METKRVIITIGREYGSGGREIGHRIASKLDIPYYDKEILARAAADSGLCEEVFHQNDEKASFGSLLSGAVDLHSSNAAYGLQMPLNQRVFLAQFDAITKIAEEGPCVIVGRCADYVLREHPNVKHIFLYASDDKRVERIMRVENVTCDKAREMVRRTDKQRRNYYSFFADGNWGVRRNYDLMLRTDNLTPEQAADLIIAFIQL